MYSVLYKRKAARYLARLDKNSRTRILAEINLLAKSGEHKNSIMLTSTTGCRLRVGDFRVLYTKEDDTLKILVVKIGPRGDVYHD